MSGLIKSACLEVAKINMWDIKLADAKPISDYQEKITKIGMEALEHYRDGGANEQDISDAIHYIAAWYALPPIGNDSRWFRTVLFALLDLAFPNVDIDNTNVNKTNEDDEVARFARKLVVGIQGANGI